MTELHGEHHDERLRDAALLIDWENLKFSLSSRGRSVSISALRDAADSHGRLVVARAYADWQEPVHAGDAPNLYASGIEPVYVPVKHYYGDSDDERGRRRNSVDVKLAADCIELCHRYPSIYTYVLASGDQDFLHVVNTLRPYGKRTVAIGVSWTTSPRLAEQVDAMIYYDRDVDPIPQQGLQTVSEKTGGDKTLRAVASELIKEVPLPGEPHPDKVGAVLEAIMAVTREYRGRGQTLLLSQLGLELQKRLTPGDFAMYVRGRLGLMVGKLAARGIVQRVQRGMVDWLFLPGEEVPEEEAAWSPAARPLFRNPMHTAPVIRVRRRYRELNRDEQDRLILRIAQIESSIEYLSFSRLAQELSQAHLYAEDDVDFRALINDLLDEGLLTYGEPREWFDPSTGKTGQFNTVRLNREYGDVQAALSESSA